MAAMKMEMISLFIGILAAVLWLQVMAPSDCQNTIAGLSPCYNYISGSSSTPSRQCCNQLETVVQTQPRCLCEVLNQGGLNQTRVLGLPQACNVQTPTASYCNPTPGSRGSHAPPPSTSSGYSTKISHSILLSVISVASCARIFISI